MNYRTAVLVTLLLLLLTIPGRASDKNFRFSRAGEFSNLPVTPWVKQVRQGSNFKVWLSNKLVMGRMAFDTLHPPGFYDTTSIGCEYPFGAGIEHLFAAGPMIGGVQDGVPKVSEAFNGKTGYGDFLPGRKDSLRDRIWRASVADTSYDASRPGFYKTPMNRLNYDDDHDGRVDEDELDGLDNDHDWVSATDDIGADGLPDTLETGCKGIYDPVRNPDPAFDNFEPEKYDSCHSLPNGSFPLKNDRDKYTERNGIPDHGEPHVDEDYGAVSENDLYLSATDTCPSAVYLDHHPLGIKVIQKSYAWDEKFADGWLKMDYSFINVGDKKISDVYAGFYADMDVGPVNVENYQNNNIAAFLPNLHSAYVHNPIDRGSTPLGLTLLKTDRPLPDLKETFQWWTDSTGGPGEDDATLYHWMAGEAFPAQPIKPDQSAANPGDVKFLYAFGPFNDLDPGDTLKITMGLVSGYCVDECPGSLTHNVEVFIYGPITDHWPSTLRSPNCKITEGNRKVSLEWGPHLTWWNNPMDFWDDSNKIAQSFPDTNWRRRNPGRTSRPGGRIFEGYRLYRSDVSYGDKSSFSLVRQFDFADDRYGINSGIDTVFVDSNLAWGHTYRYAVTSIGLPELSITEVRDSSGNIRFDSVYSDLTESYMANPMSVTIQSAASEHLRDVYVVPNPYRADQNYTGAMGFEGDPANWSPGKRHVLFENLPPKATIRIFTISGNLVKTIEHNYWMGYGMKSGQEEYYLLNENGVAIASGLYVFTVESALGRQIGKFVIIK